MRIVAHTLVKNEENFIWFAINSVIDYVDKILVWDTGSSDMTVRIIKSINNPKIELKEKGQVDSLGIARLRQEMLEITKADWFLILDGDEVWWEDSIKTLKNEIEKNSSEFDLIVSPVYMLVGDIYNYRAESLGKYRIAGKTGHLNIRAIKKIPGLHVEGVYPTEAYVGKDGTPIQNFPTSRIKFMNERYLHLSHLKRSSYSNPKFRYDLGIPFADDFYYPEVFFKERPKLIPSPWQKRSNVTVIKSLFFEPTRKIKKYL